MPKVSKLPEVPLLMREGGILVGLDTEVVLEIKAQFALDLRNVTDALRSAIAQNDVEATRFASHTLKGLAALYGLIKLSDMAELTNSHCFADMHSKVVKYGTYAVRLAENSQLKLDALFGKETDVAA